MGEVGVREPDPRIAEYHAAAGMQGGPELAWCGSFVAWCLAACRIAGPMREGKPAGAWAPSWRSWGAESKWRTGAVVVIERRGGSGAHVGFLQRSVRGPKGEGWIELLGGNQSDSVCIARFALATNTVLAVRWPE